MALLFALAGIFLADPLPKPTPLPTPPAQTADRAKPTIYCIESTITGSRIVQRDCLTRAEWIERNYDPLAPQQ